MNFKDPTECPIIQSEIKESTSLIQAATDGKISSQIMPFISPYYIMYASRDYAE